MAITKRFAAALILIALPALVGVRGTGDEARDAQLMHASELLGNDSIHLSASGARRMDQVNDFVRVYTAKSIKPEWKQYSGRIAATIIHESRRFGFDPLLLLAVIQNESRFSPDAIGTHGEIGLMQIKPDTAEWIARKAHMRWTGAASLRDPSTNIRIGAVYLAMLRAKFGASKDLYLAAYNMGVTNLNRAISSNQVPVAYSRKTIGHYSRIYIEFLGQRMYAAI